MYKIEINKLPYFVRSASVSGRELRKIANIPLNHILKFAIPRHWNLIEIFAEDQVDLTGPGTEQFLSVESE